MSHLITKPTKWLCAQQKLWSAWASAQSDQSLAVRSMGSLGPKLSSFGQQRLIRLGICPGWTESWLVAHAICLFCHAAAQTFLLSVYCTQNHNGPVPPFWISIHNWDSCSSRFNFLYKEIDTEISIDIHHLIDYIFLQVNIMWHKS